MFHVVVPHNNYFKGITNEIKRKYLQTVSSVFLSVCQQCNFPTASKTKQNKTVNIIFGYR